MGGFLSSIVRGFCTAPPGLFSDDIASAVLRSRVTVSTIASSNPLSCCLSVRRTVVPTCRVTTSAFDGVSVVNCCCWDTGTLRSMTNRGLDSDAGSSAVAVPSLTSVVSMSSGIFVILSIV